MNEIFASTKAIESTMISIRLEIFLLCLWFLIVIVFGCGNKPKLVPVKGTITIDGKALTKGTISVFQGSARNAMASIKKDGTFVFTTYAKDDGCMIGEHAIAISSDEAVNERTTRFFVPHRYADINTSGEKIKIDGPTEKLEIKLTWKGDSHKGPYTITNN
jgi:hypothetical protein